MSRILFFILFASSSTGLAIEQGKAACEKSLFSASRAVANGFEIVPVTAFFAPQYDEVGGISEIRLAATSILSSLSQYFERVDKAYFELKKNIYVRISSEGSPMLLPRNDLYTQSLLGDALVKELDSTMEGRVSELPFFVFAGDTNRGIDLKYLLDSFIELCAKIPGNCRGQARLSNSVLTGIFSADRVMGLGGGSPLTLDIIEQQPYGGHR